MPRRLGYRICLEKMKLIAHRGLLNGPNLHIENQPQQLRSALAQGFDCEVDLWVFNGNFFLGHDGPQYNVTEEFVRTPGFWIHAKNLDALYWLSTTDLVYFWHQNDDRVITSNHYLWTFPDKQLTDRSVRLLPEWKDPELKTIKDFDCYGICSDYVLKIREILG